MRPVRLPRQITEQIDATCSDDLNDYSPDGFDPLTATLLNWSVGDELHREGVPEPTSWSLMSDRERAEIRPPRRRTPAGVLRLVRGATAIDAAAMADEGEAA